VTPEELLAAHEALPAGTIKANPNNAAYPYDEYAHKMELPGKRAWFLVNTEHGGSYSAGTEFVSWPVAYSPPELFEE